MSSLTGFRLTQAAYWLSLGLWVGALVAVAIAAAVIFKTIRAHEPTIGIEPYRQLPERAGDILAGAAVGQTLRALAILQRGCAVVLVICVVLQCAFFADRLAGGAGGWRNVLRVGLLALPMMILMVDLWLVSPRIWTLRGAMYDPQRTPEARALFRVRFMFWHQTSERLVGSAAVLLVAATVASSFAFHVGVEPAGPERNISEAESEVLP
ncbi:MAG: hypothetical protein IT443_12940 [Phycisphaeraceae bacterium]|nr:hypothetical protein [Phycisphaeraceae bacterium]